MRTHPFLLLVAGASLACSVIGCATGGSSTPEGGRRAVDGSSPPPAGTLVVSAAASLTEPFNALVESFTTAHPDVDVELNLGSSGTLSRQILDGAPADVFASADQSNMADLVDAGLVVGAPRVFARNELAIVVEAGNPKGVASLADLATAGTISLCAAQAPCGAYADQVLEAAGVIIPADAITRGQNVKATLAAVAEGDADAGLVYVTDISGDSVEAVAIPQADNARATYPIATLAGSANPATAEAFVAYVLGDDGRAALEAAGFLPPA